MEKQWVYSPYFVTGIGKVIGEISGSSLIKNSEKEQYLPECWNDKVLTKFDSPIKAMAYFLVHQNYYNKKEIVNLFLRNFPSERKNIERRINFK
jgi:hypothetical protein